MVEGMKKFRQRFSDQSAVRYGTGKTVGQLLEKA